MALSSSRRPASASSQKPVEPTVAPPPSTPAETGGLSDADEISKLLSALGGEAEVDSSPQATPAEPVKLGNPSKPVDFVIPAGPGGATRPLGAVLSAPEEESVSDMDFILPDLNSESGSQSGSQPKEPPIVKLAPSADTVRLSPVTLAPRSGTGAIRLGGQAAATVGLGAVPAATVKPSNAQTVKPATAGPESVPAVTDPAKTAKHGTVRLGGATTDPKKTTKHGTVRLTGNQTEAAKTAKHGTVRLTGNQTDAAKTASSATAPAAQTAPVAAKDEKNATKEGKRHRKKAPKTRRSNGGQDPWASVVFLILVILVVLLYVGFFILRPKIIAARAASPPVQSEPAKPVARKPAVKPKPAVQTKPSGKTSTSPSVVKPKSVADTPGQTSDKPGVQTPSDGVAATAPQKGTGATAPVTDNGLGEVDVPEDDEPVVGADNTVSKPAAPSEEPAKPASKFAPPWARKDTPAQPAEEKPKEEVVIEVPAAVDVPEVREWPELKVTAVIGSGKKGSVLVNGTVVSVGEELEEGPVLKSVTRQAAVFEWDGDSRTIYVSSKSE